MLFNCNRWFIYFYLSYIILPKYLNYESSLLFSNFEKTSVCELQDVRELTKTINTISYSAEDDITTTKLILFYAFWCPHCKILVSTWNSLSNLFKCTPGIKFYAFECSSNNVNGNSLNFNISPQAACVQEGVKYFPYINVYMSKFTSKDFLSTQKEVSDVIDSGDVLRVFMPVNNVKTMETWIRSNTPVVSIKPCFNKNRLMIEILNQEVHVFQYNNDTAWNEFFHLTVNSDERWSESNVEFYFSPNAKLYDALKSLGFLLRNWVPFEYNQMALIKLKQLLHVSHVLIPGEQNWLTFEKLLQFVNSSIKNAKSWSYDEYQKFLDTVELNYEKILPKNQPPKFTYSVDVTSGLWLYFHILSVSLNRLKQIGYDRNRIELMEHNSDPISSLNKKSFYRNTKNDLSICYPGYSKEYFEISPALLATVIRDTVDFFFACKDCQENFLKSYDQCYAGRCEWMSSDTVDNVINDDVVVSEQEIDQSSKLILWLWRLHNLVTHRTATESTVVELASQIQNCLLDGIVEGSSIIVNGTLFFDKDVRFPTFKLCPQCRQSKNISTISTNLVEDMVNYELNAGIAKEPIVDFTNSEMFDAYSDFNITHVLAFLIESYWNPEWNIRMYDVC